MTPEEFDKKFGFKDGKPLKGSEYVEWKNGQQSNSTTHSTTKTKNVHGGVNLLKSDEKVLFRTLPDILTNKPAREATGVFINIPGLVKVQTDERISNREQTFDIAPKEYSTKDNKLIYIDFVVKYEIKDALKSYNSTQNLKIAIEQDIKTLIDYYVGNHNDDFFNDKRRITIDDLKKLTTTVQSEDESGKLVDKKISIIDAIEMKYGVRITSINSNDLISKLKNKLTTDQDKADAQRRIAKENEEQKIELQKKKEEAELEIQKKQLELKKLQQELELEKIRQEVAIIAEAINNSKDAQAFARAFNKSGSQDIELYHHSKKK